MLKTNFANLSQIEAFSNTLTKFENYADKLSTHRDNLLNRGQGWLDLPETAPVQDILAYAESVKGKFSHLVVLGIGGSALGITATFKALKHYYWNSLPSNQRDGLPQLFVLDNIDPHLISNLEQVIDLNKTLFITITKSGSTPETIGEYLYFRQQVEAKLGSEAIKDRFVFVTDPERGLLRRHSNEEGITAFEIPANVGGRFSVLTPVGLLPMALLGIDIKAMLAGAAQERDKFLQNEFSSNDTYQLAVWQYLLAEEHQINMNVLMPYSSALFTIADWYRQLLAESIGKEKDRAGNKVQTGITPINALGVTDQHSQVQLYTEGPTDKFFIFLGLEKNSEQDNQRQISTTEANFQYLNNVSFKKLLDTEQAATTEAITKYQKPNVTITLPEISAETIGALFMFFELGTGILGELYNIDAFNQPGVELGKVLTKEKLSN